MNKNISTDDAIMAILVALVCSFMLSIPALPGAWSGHPAVYSPDGVHFRRVVLADHYSKHHVPAPGVLEYDPACSVPVDFQ